MLIVCPNCATSYRVEPSSLGAAGRSVRCVRCRTVWFASDPEALCRRCTDLSGRGGAHPPRRVRRPISASPAALPPAAARCPRRAARRPTPTKPSTCRQRRHWRWTRPRPTRRCPSPPKATSTSLRSRKNPSPMPAAAHAGRSAHGATLARGRHRRRGYRDLRRPPLQRGQRAGARPGRCPGCRSPSGAGRAQCCADRLARRRGAVRAADRLALCGDRPAGQSARACLRQCRERDRDPRRRAGARGRGHDRRAPTNAWSRCRGCGSRSATRAARRSMPGPRCRAAACLRPARRWRSDRGSLRRRRRRTTCWCVSSTAATGSPASSERE